MVKTKGSTDKVRRKFKQSFSRQFLSDKGIEMYNGEERILEPIGKLYDIKLPNTQYLPGEQFIEQGETKKIYKFEELQSLGFVIISLGISSKDRWDAGQKVAYILRRVTETGEHLGKLPKNHSVEYDTYNKALRLIGPRAGPLGYGPWVRIERKGNDGRGGGQKVTLSGLSKDPEKILEKFANKWQGIEEEITPTQIPEAAFMITDSNEIVCFPRTADMPSILISGMKGCQIGTDTVLMSNGTFKSIKDIVIGDEVLSPQEDGSVIHSKVLKVTSWYCDEVYQIKDIDTNKLLYTCSYNHIIPLVSSTKVFHTTAKEHAKKTMDEKEWDAATIGIPALMTVPDISKIKYTDTKYYQIDSIKTEPEQVYGFTLDSPSSWYITNDFVVTHNTGKCLVQDSGHDWVVSGNGQLMKIKEKPETVLVLDKDLKVKKTRVKKYFERKVDKVLEIKTPSKKIQLTPDHPLLTINGWKRAKDLKTGDYIASPRKISLGLRKEMNLDELRFIGMYLGRGRVMNEFPRMHFIDRDHELNKKFSTLIKKIDKKAYINVQRIITSKEKKIYKILKEYNLWVKASERVVPEKIFTLSDNQIIEFISAFYTSNGSITHNYKVTMTFWGETLARQIAHLLLRIGIHTQVITPSKQRTMCRVVVSSPQMVNRFIDIIEPITRHKRYAIKKFRDVVGEKNDSRGDVIPFDVWKNTNYPADNVKFVQKTGHSLNGFAFVKKHKSNMTRRKFQLIAEYTKDLFQQRVAHSDIYWEKISHNKEITGEFTVYDIEVEHPEHNFIANDMIVHNSFALHSLVSRFFWKPAFDYKICILNDSSRETGTWCFPNKDPEQIHVLKRLGERPLPLPTVYFHPLVKEDYEKLYMGDVGFDVTIPFKEIVNNHKQYLSLKDSTRYFTKIINDLSKCKTQEEAEQLMDDLVLRYQVPSQTANKIRAEFETLFDSKMTDISTEGQNPWSTSKNPEISYNPFTASVHAGLLPVLETEFVSNYRQMLSIYFTYYVGDLFNRQKQDPDFLAEQSELMFVVDECFTPDTSINTDEGIINMKALWKKYVKGENLPKALSYDFDSHKYEYQPIERVLEKEQEELVEINLGVSKIKTTANHKMHTPKGYIKAGELKEGDLLTAHYNLDEGLARIKTIKNITHPKKRTGGKPLVYDLTVTKNHNYVVCESTNPNGVLTSNCHNISQKGIKSGADMLLRRSVREGRPRRIGSLLATQKFNELPNVIKDNTTYLICFKNIGEAQEIATTYNLGKHMANTIRDLDKHQCLAYTTEHFIIYDSNGNRRKSKLNETFLGHTLPPYSMHKRPKASGGERKK